MPTPKAIIITGPVGAGKTTTAMALAELLEHRDISCAMVDMDQLRWFHPTPGDDPFGSAVGFRHLAVMAQTWRELDIPTAILADVIEADTEGHQAAMPTYEITVVRLEVSMDRLHDRLRGRETGRQIPWHLNRAQELQNIMTTNGVGDLVVLVNKETPEQVAETIARELNLI